MATGKQISALENVVLNKLEMKDIDTVGLKDLGLPPDYEAIISSLINEEKRKPKRNRRVNFVMMEFSRKIRNLKMEKRSDKRSSETKREIKQKESLGLPVLKKAYSEHVKIGPKDEDKAFILSSIGIEDPRMRYLSLINRKDKKYNHLPDFVVVTQINEKDSGSILRAIIYIRWVEMNGNKIDFFIKELNGVEKNQAEPWIFDANKKTISNLSPSKLTTGDIIEKIKHLVRL